MSLLVLVGLDWLCILVSLHIGLDQVIEFFLNSVLDVLSTNISMLTQRQVSYFLEMALKETQSPSNPCQIMSSLM